VTEVALDGCVRKLHRAKAHLEELEDSVQAFRDTGGYRPIRHEEREGRDVTWTWDIERVLPFPDDWPILIGEILYQTHSALDHLAWHLAYRETFPSRPDKVTFPTETSEAEFWRVDNRTGKYRQSSGGWAVERMPNGAGALVDEVQPYKAGDKRDTHPLALLYVLSNQDKHQTLHVAGCAARDHDFDARHIEGLEILGTYLLNTKPFDDIAEGVGKVRARMTADYAEIDSTFGLIVEEVFSDGSPESARGLPVVKTLVAIVNYVIGDVLGERFVPFVATLQP
jgi:hypothetical protein